MKGANLAQLEEVMFILGYGSWQDGGSVNLAVFTTAKKAQAYAKNHGLSAYDYWIEQVVVDPYTYPTPDAIGVELEN